MVYIYSFGFVTALYTYLCTSVIPAFLTAYQQPFVAVPSEPCVGDTVTLHCEILLTVGNVSGLASATITRGGQEITRDTPNHVLLRERVNTIGVVVSNVTLDDDGVEYTCDTGGASDGFESSLILNVTGIAVYICIVST